jgi:long-chain acyl-CoA synthetase
MQLTNSLKRAASLRPEAVSLQCGSRSLTWRDTIERTARLAGALNSLGLGQGDRVAILAENSDRYAIVYWAVFWSGGVVVPLNTRWNDTEIQFAVDDCGCTFLIVDDSFVERACNLVHTTLPQVQLLFAGEPAASKGLVSIENMMTSGDAITDVGRCGEDCAGIFYTGGTTGAAKGVMLSHRAMWINALSLGYELGLTQDDRALNVAPLFHTAGTAMLFSLTIHAGSNAFLGRFETGAFFDAAARFQPTITLLVPTMITALTRGETHQISELKSIRKLLYGAAPIPPKVRDRALELLPNVDFFHGYGLTELGPIVSVLGPEAHRLHSGDSLAGGINSAGRALPISEVDIVGPEGASLPLNTVGEIAVRSESAMSGYWGCEQATDAAERGGWFSTGDAGYLDNDGLLYVVDRIKDMIITGGENVFSSEVENVISEVDGVDECAVVGLPDPHWGEVVAAFIVPIAKGGVEAEHVIDHCRQRISSYKCPRRVIFISEGLPKSAAGKIQKSLLRRALLHGA